MYSGVFATAILTALPYLLNLETETLKTLDKRLFRKTEKHRNASYDFIVVGAGTSGCIIASRLSKKFSVLLLEAGGDPPNAAEVPAFYEYVSDSQDINIAYTSIPQEMANNRKLGDGMGKMLGGSGSHNALVYNRGHPLDYDSWAVATKDPSWKYDALLKYFRRAETYKGVWSKGAQHGDSGPIVLETNARPIFPVWKDAAMELGYNVLDPNGPQTEGFTPSDVMRHHGRRVSTYSAYIVPHLSRPTLKIARYAFVQKILFSGSQAIGVEYVRHGSRLKAYAKKEVIISAGTYASPIILLKSGIGPSDVLEENNIEQRLDLPVGRNLQNHNGVLLGPFSVTDLSKLSSINNNLTEVDFNEYLKYKRESVLSETGLGPQAFFVSPVAKERGESNWPDTQFFHVGTNFGGSGTAQALPPTHFSVAILVGRPEFNSETLGTVTLNRTAFLKGSTDNAELAQIDYKFLKSDQDCAVLRHGIDLAMKIFRTKAFKAIGTKYLKDAECDKRHKFSSEEYWKCFVSKIGTTWFHPAGTCRMGYGKEDVNSVVDSKLRVLGIKGLRVVDASIMPYVTNGNTNAPAVVIAEKTSADILHDY